MEPVEDVVIAGAGIAGLATAVGLHRKGLRSVVLESSESLRAAGFAFTTWTNAWRALDALGVGDSLREKHVCLERNIVVSSASGDTTSTLWLNGNGSNGKHEIRCVRRKLLLEALVKELPPQTIRYSSKLVSIEEAGQLKLLHLADGSTLKTKVLIGCDGVNSSVATWLGFKKPSFSRRSATRGFAEFPDGHGFKPDFLQFVGKGFRTGFLPCDERSIYWFFIWNASPQDKEMEGNASKMKQFVLTKLRLAKVPEKLEEVVKISDLTELVSAPLRFRWPIELLWANISKENVCVAGDALHPMTPDLGQGACAALEDGIVLARCLGDALLEKNREEGEHGRIKKALEKFAKERRGRSFGLIATAYILGCIQQSDGAIMNFIRDKCLSGMMADAYLKNANFNCGKL